MGESDILMITKYRLFATTWRHEGTAHRRMSRRE